MDIAAFRKDVVACFLAGAQVAHRQSTQKGPTPTGYGFKDTSDRLIAWDLYRRARLFAVKPDTYDRLWRLTSSVLAAQVHSLHGVDVARDPNNLKAVEVVTDLARDVSLPNNLPFDSFFMCFGSRVVRWSEEQCRQVNDKALAEDINIVPIRELLALGYLVGRVGDKDWVFLLTKSETMATPHRDIFALHAVCRASHWDQVDAAAWDGHFDPWLCGFLVNLINSHRTTFLEEPTTAGDRLERRLASKRTGDVFLPLPKSFYVVNLKDEVIDQLVTRAAVQRHVEWSHRWSVRGHERIRIRRGRHADKDSARTIASLWKRGYRVYASMEELVEGASRGDEVLRDIPTCRISVADGEWVAVLRFFVKDHVKGPKDRPYVPKMYVPTKG